MFENSRKNFALGRFLSVPLDTMSGYGEKGESAGLRGPEESAQGYSLLGGGARASPGPGRGLGGRTVATTVAGFPRGISFARSARARRSITIALIVGWGIVTVLWAGYARSGKQVLVLARDIPAGQSIGAGDLRTETVGASTQIADVPATQLNQVVGERPTENLRAGVLLDRRSLTSQPVLGAAEVALPLTLDSDQS